MSPSTVPQAGDGLEQPELIKSQSVMVPTN